MSLQAFNTYGTSISRDITAAGDKISAVSMWNNLVYIGTKQGFVYQYLSDEKNSEAANGTDQNYQLLLKKPLGSKKAVMSIQPCGPLNHQQVFFSDGKISFYELTTLQRTSTAELSSVGAYCTDVAKAGQGLSVCVKGKKRLIVYFFNARTRNYEVANEYVLPDTPLNLCWTGSRVFFVFKKSFMTMDIMSGSIVEIPFPVDPGMVGKICVAGKEEIYVCTENIAVGIRGGGDPSPLPPALFPDAQNYVSVCGDFVLGAAYEDSQWWVHVVGRVDGELAQSIPLGLESANLVYYIHDGVALYADEAEVRVMRVVGLQQQLDYHLETGSLTSALSLLRKTPMNATQAKELYTRLGLALLGAGEPAEAFQAFARGKTPILSVVKSLLDGMQIHSITNQTTALSEDMQYSITSGPQECDYDAIVPLKADFHSVLITGSRRLTYTTEHSYAAYCCLVQFHQAEYVFSECRAMSSIELKHLNQKYSVSNVLLTIYVEFLRTGSTRECLIESLFTPKAWQVFIHTECKQGVSPALFLIQQVTLSKTLFPVALRSKPESTQYACISAEKVYVTYPSGKSYFGYTVVHQKSQMAVDEGFQYRLITSAEQYIFFGQCLCIFEMYAEAQDVYRWLCSEEIISFEHVQCRQQDNMYEKHVNRQVLQVMKARRGIKAIFHDPEESPTDTKPSLKSNKSSGNLNNTSNSSFIHQFQIVDDYQSPIAAGDRDKINSAPQPEEEEEEDEDEEERGRVREMINEVRESMGMGGYDDDSLYDDADEDEDDEDDERLEFDVGALVEEVSGGLQQTQKMQEHNDRTASEVEVLLFKKKPALLEAILLLTGAVEVSSEVTLRHARWVLPLAPEIGLRKIFLRSHRLVALPPVDILPVIVDVDLESTRFPYFSVCQGYQEYQLDIECTSDPVMHMALFRTYLRQLVKYDELAKTEEVYQHVDILRKRLCSFLQASEQLVLQDALQQLNNTNDKLMQERVILEARLGLHQNVLQTYMLELNDLDGAVKHCIKAASQGDRESFNVLIMLYAEAQQKNPGSQSPEALLQQIAKYASFIDPIVVCRVLPENTPISAIAGYLRNILPLVDKRANMAGLAHALAKQDHLKKKESMLVQKRGHVIIQPSSRCAECMKIIGDRAATALHPVSNLKEATGVLPPHIKTAVQTPGPNDMGLIVTSTGTHIVMHYRCSKMQLAQSHIIEQ